MFALNVASRKVASSPSAISLALGAPTGKFLLSKAHSDCLQTYTVHVFSNFEERDKLFMYWRPAEVQLSVASSTFHFQVTLLPPKSADTSCFEIGIFRLERRSYNGGLAPALKVALPIY